MPGVMVHLVVSEPWRMRQESYQDSQGQPGHHSETVSILKNVKHNILSESSIETFQNGITSCFIEFLMHCSSPRMGIKYGLLAPSLHTKLSLCVKWQ